MESEGFQNLISKLSKHFLVQSYGNFVISSSKRKSTLVQRDVRSLILDALFLFLPGPHCKYYLPSRTHTDSVWRDVTVCTFSLRSQHKLDEADKFELLVKTLLLSNDDAGVKGALQLICLLADSNPINPISHIGHQQRNLPLLSNSCKRGEVAGIPYGPATFGLASNTHPDNQFYMHYPVEVFEVATASFACQETRDNDLCDRPPGQGLSAPSLFNFTGCLGDRHEALTNLTFCGGLVESKVAGNCFDVKLDFPELYPRLDSGKAFHLNIPKTADISDDEGFVSVSSSMTNLDLDSPHNEGDETGDIWDRAWQLAPDKYSNWESRGRKVHDGERPYLSEAGRIALDCVSTIRQKSAAVLCQEAEVPRPTEISPDQLTRHSLNVMIGIPSDVFPFSEADDKFHFDHKYRVSGLTPESLASFLQDFCDCGTKYRRVARASRAVVRDSFYRDGLVVQAFASAVRRYLQHFQGAVLGIGENIAMSELKLACSRLLRQIRYIAGLCQCESSSSTLPKGVRLITYLYNEALQAQYTDHFHVTLALLRAACLPYCLFIHDWVFHGVHRDIYGEFLINFKMDAVHNRDKTYWTDAYTMSSIDSGSTPGFLGDLAHDIFVCGKSLNLLKLCNDQHFMCNVDSRHIPRMFMALTRDDLDDIQRASDAYHSRMNLISRQLSHDRETLVRRLEMGRRELLAKAKEVMEQELDTIKAKRNERKKALEIKKKQSLEEVKLNMKLESKRKADERAKELLEDKEYIERLNKKELDWSDEQAELVLQAREELLAQYRTLGEEAVRREQKALWRIRRHRLNTARRQFLVNETQRWSEETPHLDDHVDGFKMGQSEPPDWVKKDGVIVVDGEVTPDLPTWAKGHGHGVKIVGEESGGEPPNWATKHVGEVIMVGGDDENLVGSVEESSADRPTWAAKHVGEVIMVGGDDDNLVGSVEESGADRPTWAAKHVGEVIMVGGDDENEVGSVEESSADRPTWAAKHVGEVIMVGGDDDNEVGWVGEEDKMRRLSEIRDKTKLDVVGSKSKDNFTESETESKSSTVSEIMETAISRDVLLQNGTNKNDRLSRNSDSYGTKLNVVDEIVAGTVLDSHECETEMSPPTEITGKHGHPAKQTQWKILERSVFGHVSQLLDIDPSSAFIPRKKKNPAFHVSQESNFKDFGIKSQRNPLKNSDTRCFIDEAGFSSVRVYPDVRASTESQFIDTAAIRRRKFYQLNVYGHSADSTIERLLYADRFLDVETETETVDDVDSAGKLDAQMVLLPAAAYEDNFAILDREPNPDTMSMSASSHSPAAHARDHADTPMHDYIPLASLLRRSIAAPLYAQVSLVNRALVEYFHADLRLDSHFEALRRYLFMADGEFSQILSDSLFQKLSQSQHLAQVFNPMFLNGILVKAVRSAHLLNDDFAARLSFAIVGDVPAGTHNTSNAVLNSLQLQYRVDWPVNIVITDNCLHKYYTVFTFVLQLKRVVWVLKDIWFHLKRDGSTYNASTSSHFRQLQLFRQEMQHFVRVMQGYIVNQLIHVSWTEFREVCLKHVENLDGLRAAHTDYLNKVLFRCLLNKKASPILKIVYDIFTLVTHFRAQLIASPWKRESDGEMVHTKFAVLHNSYMTFRQYSSFLYSVVKKLSQRGYQPHLQELLLRLNFNGYYDRV